MVNQKIDVDTRFLDDRSVDLRRHLRHKKGIARIIELLIAITIISIILLVTYRQSLPSQETQDLSENARDILSEISTIDNLRDEVVANQVNVVAMTNTLAFINSSLPDYIKFELRACIITSSCGQSNYVGDVYSAERIISASRDEFGPVKLRLFLWVEE
ncbi:MAG: hypothetical protein AABX10_03080 [Nanoarchaeota archaeon]